MVENLFTSGDKNINSIVEYCAFENDFDIVSSNKYRKVASSRPVYYSILELLGQRSQYIRVKFALHKPSENPWVCQDSLLFGTSL